MGELIVTGKKKNYNDDRKFEYVYFAGTYDAKKRELNEFSDFLKI